MNPCGMLYGRLLHAHSMVTHPSIRAAHRSLDEVERCLKRPRCCEHVWVHERQHPVQLNHVVLQRSACNIKQSKRLHARRSANQHPPVLLQWLVALTCQYLEKPPPPKHTHNLVAEFAAIWRRSCVPSAKLFSSLLYICRPNLAAHQQQTTCRL